MEANSDAYRVVAYIGKKKQQPIADSVIRLRSEGNHITLQLFYPYHRIGVACFHTCPNGKDEIPIPVSKTKNKEEIVQWLSAAVDKRFCTVTFVLWPKKEKCNCETYTCRWEISYQIAEEQWVLLKVDHPEFQSTANYYKVNGSDTRGGSSYEPNSADSSEVERAAKKRKLGYDSRSHEKIPHNAMEFNNNRATRLDLIQTGSSECIVEYTDEDGTDLLSQRLDQRRQLRFTLRTRDNVLQRLNVAVKWWDDKYIVNPPGLRDYGYFKEDTTSLIYATVAIDQAYTKYQFYNAAGDLEKAILSTEVSDTSNSDSGFTSPENNTNQSYYTGNSDENSIDTILGFEDSSFGSSGLHWAALSSDPKYVRTWTQKFGDVNVTDDDDVTPLHLAAWAGNINVAQYLLDKGGNPRYRARNGKTPLDHAKENKDEKMITLIETYLAKQVDGNTLFSSLPKEIFRDMSRRLKKTEFEFLTLGTSKEMQKLYQEDIAVLPDQVATIKVLNLPSYVQKKEIEIAFEKCGDIVKLKIGAHPKDQSKKHCKIQFHLGFSAERAVKRWNRKLFQRSRLQIQFMHEVICFWDSEVYYAVRDARRANKSIPSLSGDIVEAILENVSRHARLSPDSLPDASDYVKALKIEVDNKFAGYFYYLKTTLASSLGDTQEFKAFLESSGKQKFCVQDTEFGKSYLTHNVGIIIYAQESDDTTMILVSDCKKEKYKDKIDLFGGTCNFGTQSSPADAAAHRLLQNITDVEHFEPTSDEKKFLVEVIDTKSQTVFDREECVAVFAINFVDLPAKIKATLPKVGGEHRMKDHWKKSRIYWEKLSNLLDSLRQSVMENQLEALHHWAEKSEDMKQTRFYRGVKTTVGSYNNPPNSNRGRGQYHYRGNNRGGRGFYGARGGRGQGERGRGRRSRGGRGFVPRGSLNDQFNKLSIRDQ